jgi:hypothetical protein
MNAAVIPAESHRQATPATEAPKDAKNLSLAASCQRKKPSPREPQPISMKTQNSSFVKISYLSANQRFESFPSPLDEYPKSSPRHKFAGSPQNAMSDLILNVLAFRQRK